jgi:hypothetical protein
VRVPGADDHEIYLSRPDLIADFLAATHPGSPSGRRSAATGEID